jgi:hypothetical protein
VLVKFGCKVGRLREEKLIVVAPIRKENVENIFIFLLIMYCKFCIILKLRKTYCILFLFSGFRLGIGRAMARAFTICSSRIF